MKLIFVNSNRLRPKLAEKINKYLALSEHNRLTIGLYKNGKCYVFGSTEENRLFYSGRILDVKEKKERGISYFYHQLDSELCPNVTICVVPSHTEGGRNESGIAELARRLARNGRINKVDYLLRTKTIDKLVYGGSRDIRVQL